MSEEIKKSNPAPLGLLGFGMTTILLNLHNAGLFKLDIAIAAMGFAMGGLAQIIAGVLEFKNGNTFGGTAFTAYGMFWWSLVIIWWNPFALAATVSISFGSYLLIWGMFTAFMFVGALKHNTITKIVFGSLAILFIMLALGVFFGSDIITIMAGAVGIFCGLSAFYSSVGQVVNGEYGKKVFPFFK